MNTALSDRAFTNFTYKDNEQILIEIKKLMLETKTTQREIADKLGIKPQGLTKILNKKNFGFEDAQKILATMGYDLVIDFKQATEEI
jgi:transcriptional regulator with XRE-family HTH domain